MSIGLSIGVALFPQHGTDAKSLLAHADLAMYAAKKGTRDIVAYTDALGEAQSKSTRIAGQLPDALENNELFLEFQPKINLRSMNLIGVEAFVRWRHPELGVLLPMDFIPAAEQSSIIGPLSSIVVDMALTHAAAWQKDFPTLSVSVNLSAQLVDDPGLAASVFQALNLRAMPPSALVIELTETALMTSPVRAARALKELSAGGVAISIDDFGTGFFSFKNLRDLEIAEIKIDTTFVAKLLEGGRDATIVRSLVELARGFDIRLVAEGIEDELTCDMLRRMKCDCGQGYWIGRPMDSQKLPDWAAHWEHRNNRTVGAPRV